MTGFKAFHVHLSVTCFCLSQKSDDKKLDPTYNFTVLPFWSLY